MYDASELPEVFSLVNGIGGLLCFVGGCLCAGAGIGGGAFYIPVFVLLLGFDPHIAIPLSKATIFGVAVGGYIVNHRKRHPYADRPLICYDVAMIMEPMTLLGTVIGVYMNVVFPAYLILLFLIILLSFTTYKTAKKGLTLFKQEQETEAQDFCLQLEVVDTKEKGEEFEGGKNSLEEVEEEEEDEDEEMKKEEETETERKRGEREMDNTLLEILEKEKKIPLKKIGILFLVWVGVFLLLLLKGGTSSGTSLVGLDCGSFGYWLIVFAEFPFLMTFTYFYCRYIFETDKEKREVGYQFIEGDIEWTVKNLFFLPSLSVIAGIAAGFLGIGGGMVKGPLMLSMGMISHVSTATSSFMILFTSSSTTMQYLILGKIPIYYALYYFTIGIFGAIVGNMWVSYIVKKYKKQSYVAFLLAFCTVCSACLMSLMLVLGIVNGTESTEFSGVCDVDEESVG